MSPEETAQLFDFQGLQIWVAFAETLNTRDTNEKETYKNLVGVVSTSKEFGPVEYGLGLTVDMSYHGKQDTHTETFIQLTPFMELDTFEEICQDK